MAFPSPFNLTLQCTCLGFYLWFRALAAFCMPFFSLLNVYILGAQHIPVTTRKRNILISAWGAPSGEKGLGEVSQCSTGSLKCIKLDSPAREIDLSMLCYESSEIKYQFRWAERLAAQAWDLLLFCFASLWFFLSLSCLFMFHMFHKVLGMSLVAAIIVTIF